MTIVWSNGDREPFHFYKDYKDGIWKCIINNKLEPKYIVYKSRILQSVYDVVCRYTYK